MTEIERKALAWVNEVNGTDHHCLDATYIFQLQAAICRAIERIEELEANERNYAKPLMELQAEFEAFRREVSDAVEQHIRMTDEDCSDLWRSVTRGNLSHLILPKPVDPLVEALREVVGDGYTLTEEAKALRAALAKRNAKIVWEAG